MSLGILGNKVGMTQIFDTKGDAIPVTIIQGGPCYITQIKSTENCGYDAVQIGYSEMSANSRTPCIPLSNAASIAHSATVSTKTGGDGRR